MKNYLVRIAMNIDLTDAERVISCADQGWLIDQHSAPSMTAYVSKWVRITTSDINGYAEAIRKMSYGDLTVTDCEEEGGCAHDKN